MGKFPVDAPKRKVVKALEMLGFRIVREKEHISMVRENPDGTHIPLTSQNKSLHAKDNLHTV
jgi:predicted RNA binding protein YcfA (HicA-like mRNA interferase family)